MLIGPFLWILDDIIHSVIEDKINNKGHKNKCETSFLSPPPIYLIKITMSFICIQQRIYELNQILKICSEKSELNRMWHLLLVIWCSYPHRQPPLSPINLSAFYQPVHTDIFFNFHFLNLCSTWMHFIKVIKIYSSTFSCLCFNQRVWVISRCKQGKFGTLHFKNHFEKFQEILINLRKTW